MWARKALRWTTLAAVAALWVATAGSAAAADKGPHCPEPPIHRPLPNGYWVPLDKDWRAVNWSGDGWKARFHRQAQALNLAVEDYFESRRCWPAATNYRMPVLDLHYMGDVCGPRSTRKPKSNDCR